jgi:hypothetical protein
VLTVTGRGGTYADFTVTATTTFDYDHAVIHGDGRFAGVAIWNVARTKSYSGVVVLADLDRPARPVALGATNRHALTRSNHLGIPVVRLAPGRYRVYALGDGAVSFAVPVEGPSVDVATGTPFGLGFRSAATDLDPAARGKGLRIPATFRGRTMYYAIGRVWARLGTQVSLRSCFTRSRATCARGETVSISPHDTSTGTGYDEVSFGSHGRLLGPHLRDVRTEVTYTGLESGTLALGFLWYDLA